MNNVYPTNSLFNNPLYDVMGYIIPGLIIMAIVFVITIGIAHAYSVVSSVRHTSEDRKSRRELLELVLSGKIKKDYIEHFQKMGIDPDVSMLSQVIDITPQVQFSSRKKKSILVPSLLVIVIVLLVLNLIF